MKDYLKSTVNQLKNFSLSLDKKSILIDKPWAMIDEEFELQKLIFKKNKELILSKNGKVEIGKWDYFPEARSLLIDRNTDKILCNEGFIDSGVLILKLDGTDSKFFILANENIVPGLDTVKYLSKLRKEQLNIGLLELEDGREVEIHMLNGNNKKIESICEGQRITEGLDEIEDSFVKVKNSGHSYYIKNGRISNIYIKRNFKLKEGNILEIHQLIAGHNSHGDRAYIDSMPAPDGVYKIGMLRSVTVKNGKIKKDIVK